jgi:pantoate--beta-alanine ligase
MTQTPHPGRPVLVTTREELSAALVPAPTRRAVVMTMGALHAGHLALVERARRLADQVVVTIFVNPLQFGPAEDLDRYPRDLRGDLTLLAAAGVDVVFAPTAEVVYPDGDPTVTVSAGIFGEVLEGAARPGHLDGVLTVVLKLLHLVRPDVALFGQKDAQQLMAVRRMVQDLDVPVRIDAVPTVRDPDGLALSSRNAFLSPEDRSRACGLSAALFAGAACAGSGADAVRAAATVALRSAGLEVEYLALVDPLTVAEVDDRYAGEAVLALAARVGSTRLIDNVPLTLR